MKVAAPFLFAFALVNSACAAASLGNIKQSLKDGGIVPNVLDDFEPTSELRITYHVTKQLTPGTDITLEEVESAPHVWFSNADHEAQYTLVMFDADHPSQFMRHWVVTNIDGAKPGTSVADMSPVHQYTPYQAPNIEEHRYVFALFQQPQTNQSMFPMLEELPSDRSAFDIKRFATDNKLKLVSAIYMNAHK